MTVHRSWRDEALCLGVDVDIFFPDERDHATAAEAKRICGQCPSIDACLDDALRNPTDGIRAGLTRRQRGQLKRRNPPTIQRKPAPGLPVGGSVGNGMSTTGGRGVPVPTEARPIPQRGRVTRSPFTTTTPAPKDPDAVARLKDMGISKASRPKRKPGPKRGTVTREPTFDIAKAARLYETGMSSRAVAREVGVSPETVRVRLAEIGVQIRGRECGNQKPRAKREAPFDVDEALQLAREGWTSPDLAQRYGVGRKTVWRRLTEAGHEFKVGGSKKRVDAAEVRRLRGQGLSQSEIARRIGFSERAVRNHLAAQEAS